MANKDLSRDPHDVDDHAWWYEQPRGINLVVQHHDQDGVVIHTKHYMISWKAIRNALARKDK